MLTLLYFAWVREAVGMGEERIILPPQVVTVADLAHHLATLSPAHARAFSDLQRLRVAVDLDVVDFATAVVSAREIAFFPPVTGG